MLTHGRKWIRFIPGLVNEGLWLRSLVAIGFYGYTILLVSHFGRWIELAASPRTDFRLDAIAIAGGLAGLYIVGVSPARRGSATERTIRGFVRRFQSNRLAVAGLLLILVVLGASILAPIIAPYDPIAQDRPVESRYQGPTLDHPMGTDKFGRDVLSRVIYGARTSLGVGVVAISLASLLGLLLGSFSAYVGGWLDDVTMRIVDGLLSFPRLLLVLTLVALFGHSLVFLVVLLAVTGWMGTARLVRAQVLTLKQREFVQAAIATGVGAGQIVWKHLVPNALGVVLVSASLRVGAIILLESYLSFLGLGVQPPTPSWGSMVFEGRDVLLSAWWVSFFPGLAIVVATVSCNLLGDGLRDSLDVRIP